MVNGITTPGSMPALGAVRPGSGASGGAPQKVDPPVVEVKTQAAAATVKAPVPAAPVVSVASTPPLAPDLTSLALYRDSESGMQVAVVRDRISGEVVEQFPTERARRLAAMVRAQEVVAQELQGASGDMPHLDLKT